jgi:FixJ family two-component response regulator
LDILQGTPPAKDISEFLNVPAVPMFDWRQLRRWNLSESALPKGSILVNGARVMEKMGARSLADLVRFAEKLGIRSSPA